MYYTSACKLNKRERGLAVAVRGRHTHTHMFLKEEAARDGSSSGGTRL